MNVRRTRIMLWLTAAVLGAATVAVVAAGLQLPYVLAEQADAGGGGNPVPVPHDELPRLEPADFRAHWSLDLHRPLHDPPPPRQAAPTGPPPLRLRLVGTVIEPGHAQAIVRTADGEIAFKREGDTADGARIERIEETRIEVTYHDERIALSIEER